jgi:hypothetical protein
MKSDFILMVDKKIDFLVTAFPEVEFSLYRAIVSDNSFISAFSCLINNEEVLEKLWSRINNLIGAEYQTRLDDKFSSWNIYLTFFIPKKINNSLKYTIENNTFFVRKMIFDNHFTPLDGDRIGTYLNNHILGKDIKVEKNPILESINVPLYTSITKNLLNAKLSLGKTADEKKLRDEWLDKAILKVDDDEN